MAFLYGASEGTYHSAKGAALGERRQDEHLTGQTPVAGDVAGFAGPPSRVAVITIAVVTPGLSYYLYRSANGGEDLGRDRGLQSHQRGELHLLVLREPGGGLDRD